MTPREPMATISNDKLYELVDRTRLELKGDIIRVDVKVEMLTNDLGKVKEKEATLATKVYVLVFILSSIVSALITALSYKLVGR